MNENMIFLFTWVFLSSIKICFKISNVTNMQKKTKKKKKQLGNLEGDEYLFTALNIKYFEYMISIIER